MATGLVIKNTGSWYTVEDLATGKLIPCRIKGKLRLKGIRTTKPVTVGDRVEYAAGPGADSVVSGIHERTNYIIRKSSNLAREAHIIAANLDLALVIVTLDFPPVNPEFLDRFLVTAEAYNVPARIVLNKIDLFGAPYAERLAEFHEAYRMAGYEVIEASALTGVGIDRLRDMIRDKVTLFSGNSGVGKSTLVQTIDPSLTLRTGEISSYHNKGKHTTTFSEMFKLTEGGYLIDTPGIKGFGLIDFEKDEISRYFPEIFRHSVECQYYNCTHTHEPGCTVKEAVEAGKVSASRYISYLKLLEEDEKYRK
ncbi:MAG: ribosome small subunit-dependent GTPase A [Rikenellaceae bacterium]|jgi:ribosome biogenesis GTPase|nr:ribosome small subunit-dependent GTPase A [Rikenellaceae bacterium]